jgi:hypothetical protein
MDNSMLGRLQNWGRQLQDIPGQADAITNRYFAPGSTARDNSTGNAFRHALGTGMLAQHLGGGPLAAVAAKAMGYGWELMGMGNWGKASGRLDTLHDLNANAIGAQVAQQTGNTDELAAALKRLALESVVTPRPPGAFSATPGYLTRSER